MTHKVVQEVSVAEVWERIKRGESLRLVDVREVEEVEERAIPGIRHISLRDLPDRYEEIDPNVETILVCRSGRRSNIACKFLMFLGYQNVKNMTGGMNQWSGEVRSIG